MILTQWRRRASRAAPIGAAMLVAAWTGQAMGDVATSGPGSESAEWRFYASQGAQTDARVCQASREFRKGAFLVISRAAAAQRDFLSVYYENRLAPAAAETGDGAAVRRAPSASEEPVDLSWSLASHGAAAELPAGWIDRLEDGDALALRIPGREAPISIDWVGDAALDGHLAGCGATSPI